MDLYDIGLEPHAITQQMFDKYLASITHNALFAIAKAEWSLGFRSKDVFLRVNEIIDNDENIKYYRSLGFSEQELNERKKKLLKFQTVLLTTKKAPRKRKISAYNKIKRLPKGTETTMVLELMRNPASEFAKNMIRKSVYSEDFFH